MTRDDCEHWLSGFWEAANASGLRIPIYLARHPRSALKAIKYTLELPRLEAILSDAPEGITIKKNLERICLVKFLRLANAGACVLPIPTDPSDYSVGSSKQTLRRKVRSATRSGVTCRAITDLEHQREIAKILDRTIRTKSNPLYRNLNADSADLIDGGLWTVAFDQNGVPLVVAVTPLDGNWALLRSFVSLGDTPQHSDARYLLTQAMVERLANHRVTYLVDSRSSSELPNGLRHFQRMLGFRIARIQISNTLSAPVRANNAQHVRSAWAVRRPFERRILSAPSHNADAARLSQSVTS
ncbi:hypothetical protein FOHLNKBM_5325 [Methylobacterium longum]|nr:hypothetical protein FOHLNKBM_5325 [Methylobacterium longum]